MKTITVFFTLLILSLCGYAQRSKVIDWPPNVTDRALGVVDGKYIPSDTKAIEIVEMKVEGQAILPGRQFSAGDDWLRTFAVRVRNVSGKSISSIYLQFILPEANVLDRQSGFHLEYGKELGTGIDSRNQAAIEAGQEIVLLRSEREYARQKEGITKGTGMTEFNSVTIGISTVKFGDGTVWYSYKVPFPAASTPRK